MTVRDVENIKPSHIIKSPTWQEFQHQLKDPRYMEHFAQLDAQFARHFMATNSGKSILAKDDSTSQKKDEDVKIVPDEKIQTMMLSPREMMKLLIRTKKVKLKTPEALLLEVDSHHPVDRILEMEVRNKSLQRMYQKYTRKC